MRCLSMLALVSFACSDQKPSDQGAPAEFALRISKVLSGCGDICNTSIPDPEDHSPILKAVDCDWLLKSEELDEPIDRWPPPEEIPDELYHHFTHNGLFKTSKWLTGTLCVRTPCKQNASRPYLGGGAKVIWSEELVNKYIALAKKGLLKGAYGLEETENIRRAIDRLGIEGKHVLVIGSETPWLEACLLEKGARHVTTLEYSSIVCEHPAITVLTPEQIRRKYVEGSLRLFDAIATFSSVEHSGLGRYGDGLNPWGDLQQVARAWCMTKRGGRMLLGVPGFVDEVVWNAHRIYGPKMLPHLTANWRLYFEGESDTNQPIRLYHRLLSQVSTSD